MEGECSKRDAGTRVRTRVGFVSTSISSFVMPCNRRVATISTMRGLVGAPCGAAVGAVGLHEGAADGTAVIGALVGAWVGAAVGATVGAVLGLYV